MVQKITVLVSAGIVLALALISYGQGTKSISEPARFQVVPVELSTITRDGRDVRRSTAFKVDTQTGETWQWVSAYDRQGNLVETWSHVP